MSDFGLQVISKRVDGLAAGQVVENQQVNFPNGGIILGVTGGASLPSGSGDAAQVSGLDLFALSMEYQQQRQIVGTAKVIASSVFGPFNDIFPAIELSVPTNGMLIYGFESLITANAIGIMISHHCLVPLNVG
jgi:hypothetical protein